MRILKLMLAVVLVLSLVYLTMAKPWGSNERYDNRRRNGDRDRYDGRGRDRYDTRGRDRYDGRQDHNHEHYHSRESILDVISDFLGK